MQRDLNLSTFWLRFTLGEYPQYASSEKNRQGGEKNGIGSFGILRLLCFRQQYAGLVGVGGTNKDLNPPAGV